MVQQEHLLERPQHRCREGPPQLVGDSTVSPDHGKNNDESIDWKPLRMPSFSGVCIPVGEPEPYWDASRTRSIRRLSKLPSRADDLPSLPMGDPCPSATGSGLQQGKPDAVPRLYASAQSVSRPNTAPPEQGGMRLEIPWFRLVSWDVPRKCSAESLTMKSWFVLQQLVSENFWQLRPPFFLGQWPKSSETASLTQPLDPIWWPSPPPN